MPNADLVREVTQTVEDAIRRNGRIETVLIVILVLLTATGIGLMIYGAAIRQGLVALPGSLCQLAVAMPIRSLVKLRQENIRLQILPQLIRMADSASEKKLVMKFVTVLIQQIAK